MEVFGSVMKDESDLVNIKWITDKQTQQFYGTAFLEFTTSDIAKRALKLNGTEIMGRETQVELTQPLKPKAPRGGSSEGPKGEKPIGCTKIFVGNVAYESTDDELASLFGACGAVKMVRWLTHQDTGEFKGCGFVDFYDTASVDEAVKLSGKELHGRCIRVDYS